MAENVERTTISVARAVMRAGVARAKALGYKTFSAYVAYLIDEDVRKRPDHVHIRREQRDALKTLHIEQPPEYGVMRAAEEPLADEIAAARKRLEETKEPNE